MKKLFTLIILGVFVFTLNVSNSSTGGPPGALNNAPGVGNCTGCHTGTLQTSGTAINNMTLTTSVPLSAMLPNTTYTLSLTFSDPGRTKYGFQLSVLPANATTTSASTGTLINTSTETQVNTRGNRTYVEHTASGTSAPGGTKTWTFDYTTPATTGTPVFYVVVNSTNSNSGTGGDVIYAKTFSSTILPVQWGKVYIEHENTHNSNLIWETLTEINNAHFTIEKSNDAIHWDELTKVKGKGNSKIRQTYRVKMNKEIEATYYRIKQTDYDGQHTYSPVVYSNDALHGQIQLTYVLNEQALFLPALNYDHIRLIGLDGSEMTVQKEYVDGLLKISTAHLKSGIYLVQAVINGKSTVLKVLIN